MDKTIFDKLNENDGDAFVIQTVVSELKSRMRPYGPEIAKIGSNERIMKNITAAILVACSSIKGESTAEYVDLLQHPVFTKALSMALIFGMASQMEPTDGS